ncbi:MAG: glycoside hydrolase family 92 protein [Alphaproteobacteria bacterium]|nr:glycoside hydrolase family 92 protein [Alphaproteobacteria bacterium]
MTMLFALALLACKPEADETPVPSGPIDAYDPVDHVDPFIGTGGEGAQVASVSPGASRPFGLTLVGPDTAADYGSPGFYHCAGYHWPDSYVMGFSHLHAHGMGVPDYAAVQVMPQTRWDPAFVDSGERQLPFTHDREWATPGWYSVELDGGAILAEIAATERGAAHRYTFAPGTDPVLIVDLGFHLQGNSVETGRAEVDLAQGTLHGFQNLDGSYSGRFGGLMTHFAARLDPAPIAAGTWADGVLTPGSTSVDGGEVGVWLEFPAGTTVVQLDLAVSYVDDAGALGNLSAELPLHDIDAVAADARQAWVDELSNVRVRGDARDLRIFHTAQYHAMLMPSLQQDVDGRYRGLDQAIHTVDHDYYSDFSLWDTFRTQHPWLLLTRPQRQRDMVKSLLRMTDDGGSLPRWPLAHGYTGGMVGTPAIQVLAGSALKGLGGFDEAHALDISLRAALEGQADAGRAGQTSYNTLGYVSMDEAGQAASRTLEYAWSDHALSVWAAAAGHPDAAEVASMGTNWRNTFDPVQGHFAGRYSDGSFVELESDLFWASSFTEGNAWHYRWGAFWDPQGMVDHTHGGDLDAALAEMASYWDRVEAEPDDDLPDDWYWHGNEPDLHYALVPAMLGQPELTARAVDLLVETRYDDTEEGLDGNDDAGTLSAWYLFNAIGFYPVAGTPDYVVGSPVFERTEIDLEDGTMLVIEADGEGPVRSVRLGDAEAGWVVDHGALVSAGRLVLER